MLRTYRLLLYLYPASFRAEYRRGAAAGCRTPPARRDRSGGSDRVLDCGDRRRGEQREPRAMGRAAAGPALHPQAVPPRTGVRVDRDCGQRTGNRRDHGDVLDGGPRAAASASLSRARPARARLGGSVVPRLSAARGLAGQFPRLAADEPFVLEPVRVRGCRGEHAGAGIARAARQRERHRESLRHAGCVAGAWDAASLQTTIARGPRAR